MTPAPLSRAQETWLIMVEAADRTGVSASLRHATLNALQRRGFVEPHHCRTSLDNRRWVATYAGREWVKARTHD